jgi:hypothetical protein
MSTKHIAPRVGLSSYSCPHCGAVAHQYWYRALITSVPKGNAPSVLRISEIAFDPESVGDDEVRANLMKFLERFEKNALTCRTLQFSIGSTAEMVNFWFSQCHSCDGFTIWFEDKILYPAFQSEISAHEDMPASVKADFDEAVSIIALSPRGAAALLRLCIQKLMIELEFPGENLNDDIGALVKKGLDWRIQQALDVVRVIGNNAVHPGEIDLTDDHATAIELCSLVNIIVASMISVPKRIDEMYASLPTTARGAIEKRDSPPKK